MLELNAKLKPCPFCGNDIYIENLSTKLNSNFICEIDSIELKCNQCEVSFKIEQGTSNSLNVIDIWNLRKE